MKTITIDGVEYALVPKGEVSEPLIKRYDISHVRGYVVDCEGDVEDCTARSSNLPGGEEWATRDAAERAAALIELQKQCIANGGDICVYKEGWCVSVASKEAEAFKVYGDTFADILFDSEEKADAFVNAFYDLILKAQPK